jgi:hypothetical protein
LIESGPKGKKAKNGPASTIAPIQPQAGEGAAAFAAIGNATVVAASILTDNPDTVVAAPILTDNPTTVVAVPILTDNSGTVVGAPILSDNPTNSFVIVPTVAEEAEPKVCHLQDCIESGRHTITASRAAPGGDIVVNSIAGSEKSPEELNKKALDIIQRVRDKLTGRDFDPKECLDVHKQVDFLIQQATSNENLCQCYIGWCPFW